MRRGVGEDGEQVAAVALDLLRPSGDEVVLNASPLVGFETRVRERLSIAARTTSSCPGRKGVEASELAERGGEIGQAGEYRSASGGAGADFVPTSAPAER